MVGKHSSRLCEHCRELETAEHVLLVCGLYGEERRLMREGLRRLRMDGGDERHILRCLESSGGKEGSF